MTHCTEEQLILHYYAEDRGQPDVERHLAACAECAAEYHAMVETLQLVVAPAVPERDDSYALDVWTRIRTRLPERAAPWWHAWLRWDAMTVAVAVATVVVAAFVAGRVWPRAAPAAVPPVASIDAEAGERVRLAAIGDHLERSERVLLDLVNADDPSDLSTEQAWAADLLDSNRLFRNTASQAQDSLVAGVLDELERGLLEVVHGPSMPTPAEFEAVRTRLDADALLFKVRVLADELHEREIAPVQPRKTT
jgi:hypothetical protein